MSSPSPPTGGSYLSMSIATAARELLEETGHRAEQMWPVAESFANAASQTNRV